MNSKLSKSATCILIAIFFVTPALLSSGQIIDLEPGKSQQNLFVLEAIGEIKEENGYTGDMVDQEQNSSYGGVRCPWGKLAQSFTPSMPYMTRLQLFGWRNGNPDKLTVSIRPELDDPPLVTSSLTWHDIPTQIGTIEFDFEDIVVTPGEKYYIIWTQVGGNGYNVFYWGFGDGNPYPRGEPWIYSDGYWEQLSLDVALSPDFCFRTYGMDNMPPVADAGGPYLGVPGDTIMFDGSGSSDPDGDNLSYQWDFGDGTTGTGVTPSHVYTSEGQFEVTLTVTDSHEASSTNTTSAVIDDSPPEIQIRKPGGGLYWLDRKLVPFPIPIVIGDVTVEVEASDSLSDIKKVSFYVDGEQRYEVTEQPYEWRWSPQLGKHSLSVLAYDLLDHTATDDLTVWTG